MENPVSSRAQSSPAGQALEERIAQLERMMGALADASRASLQGLQDVQRSIAQFRHDALATRMFEDLATTSKLYPKQRTIIFMGREYFADNVKYAFLSFLDFARANNIACYYLPETDEQEKHLAAAGLPYISALIGNWSIEHMRIMLGAKVAVLCNIFHPYNEQRHLLRSLLAGAKIVQLWHGMLFKEGGLGHLSAPGDFGERTAMTLAASGPFDVFVAQGKALLPKWRERFVFRRFEPIGYVRNDVMFREPSARDLINVDTETLAKAAAASKQGKPVVFYAPTFRDKNLGEWFLEAGIDKLADHCRAHNYELLVNIHPFEQVHIAEFQKRFPGITFIAIQTDIYPILPYVNVLISDYSSLVYDYLLLDRPFILYRPDHADYIGRSRPIIEGQDPVECGAVTTAIGDLLAAVDAAVAAAKQPDSDPYAAQRQALRQKLHDHIDGKTGERLNALLKQQIEQD